VGGEHAAIVIPRRQAGEWGGTHGLFSNNSCGKAARAHHTLPCHPTALSDVSPVHVPPPTPAKNMQTTRRVHHPSRPGLSCTPHPPTLLSQKEKLAPHTAGPKLMTWSKRYRYTGAELVTGPIRVALRVAHANRESVTACVKVGRRVSEQRKHEGERVRKEDEGVNVNVNEFRLGWGGGGEQRIHKGGGGEQRRQGGGGGQRTLVGEGEGEGEGGNSRKGGGKGRWTNYRVEGVHTEHTQEGLVSEEVKCARMGGESGKGVGRVQGWWL
jgi:hypothetical protein